MKKGLLSLVLCLSTSSVLANGSDVVSKPISAFDESRLIGSWTDESESGFGAEISFSDDGWVYIYSGCYSSFGGFRVDQNYKLKMGLLSNAVARDCGEARNNYDYKVGDLLDSPTISMSDDSQSLILTRDGKSMVFTKQ